MNTFAKCIKKYVGYTDEPLLLVFHPQEDSYWNVRHLYGKEGFNPFIRYNHRTIFSNEVVIEFDDDTPAVNRKHADTVFTRAKKLGFYPSKWSSGNKSTHVHFFFQKTQGATLSLLKGILIKHLCKGLPSPDLKLTSDGHLIRAEYGVHEKTGKTKQPISISKHYPTPSPIPVEVWQTYSQERYRLLNITATEISSNLVEHGAIQFLLDSANVRELVGDGRERIMWLLINVLKKNMERKELVHFIKEWYKYANGNKLDSKSIENKIDYQYRKSYTITVFTIYKVCQEIGLDVSKHLDKKEGADIL